MNNVVFVYTQGFGDRSLEDAQVRIVMHTVSAISDVRLSKLLETKANYHDASAGAIRSLGESCQDTRRKGMLTSN